MKTKWLLICAIALLSVVYLVACGNEDDPAVTPEFPKKETITIEAGVTHTLNFKANMDWKVTVDKTWVTFMNGENELGQSDLGAASTESISRTIKVKDSNWGFNADTAKVALTMDGKTEVIFMIERPGKSRVVKMYIFDGYQYIPATEIELTYLNGGQISSSTTISFVANYNWILELPENAAFSEESLSGTAGDPETAPTSATFENISGRISIKDEFIPFAFDGKIKIKDQDSDAVTEFTLTFPGMDEEHLIIDTKRRFEKWSGILFTDEGYFIEKRAGNEMVTEDKEISFSVKARNMEYSYYLVEINENNAAQIVNEEGAWINLTETAIGEFKLSVKSANTGSNRTLYVLFLPKALATGTPDLSIYFENGAPIDYEIIYALAVHQKSVAVAGGFEMSWGIMGSISGEDIVQADADLLLMVGNNAPADNTYMYFISDAQLTGASSLLIYPIGWKFDQNWNLHYKIVTLSGNWDTVSKEITQGSSDDIFNLSLGNLASASGSAVILFYNSEEDVAAEKPMAAMVLERY